MYSERDKFERWFAAKHKLFNVELSKHRSDSIHYATYQGKAKCYLEHDWEVWRNAKAAI